MLKFFLFFVSLFLNLFFFTQESLDSTDKSLRNFHFAGYPTASYSTETSWLAGAYVATSFRFKGQGKETTPSQLSFTFAYTGLNQIINYLPFQIFSKNNTYIVKGEIGYYRYFYRFFGVGNELPYSNDEIYKVNFPRVRLYPLKKINKTTFVGINYAFDAFNIVEKEVGGVVIKDSLTGSNGGFLSGFGPSFRYDTRDNFYFPTKGGYFDISSTFHSRFLGASFEYGKVEYSFAVFKEDRFKNVWAFNYFGGFNTGNPPLFDLMEYGGSRKGRGSFTGRFRDRIINLMQFEYRFKFFKENASLRFPFLKRFSAVVFASYGGVTDKIENYQLAKLRLNAGAGLRYAIDPKERINMRIDFGGFDNAPDGSFLPGIYIVLGEAF